MTLSGSQCRGLVVGLLVLGLVSCGGNSQPQSATPEATPTSAPPTSAPPTSAPKTTPEAAPAATPEATEADIWAQLRQADTHYYVLMRHALAPGTGDPANFQLDDCSTQRNLSEEGRDQARRTGEAIREQNVAVQQVLSSQWCRCLETAELLDLGPVEPLPALNSFFQNRDLGPERTQQLQEFMVSNRDQAGVSVLVTHFVNISAIAGSGVSSGEIVVMQVDDQNELQVVAQIEPF